MTGVADQGRVTQIVERLAEVTPSRSFTETLSPAAEYGLAEPGLQATLRLADGQVETLHIGAADPLQRDYYAQVEGSEAVHLIASWLVTSLHELLANPPVQPTPTPASDA